MDDLSLPSTDNSYGRSSRMDHGASFEGQYDEYQTLSVGGLEVEGLEGTAPREQETSSVADDGAFLSPARIQREDGAVHAGLVVWQQISNKTLGYAETAKMLKDLSIDDPPVTRIFAKGHGGPLAEVAIPPADQKDLPNVTVRIVFLPGADKPQVNRMEEIGMTRDEPNQRTALWRVNTAGSLLTVPDVTQDLDVKLKHNPAVFEDIKRRIEHRPRRNMISKAPDMTVALRNIQFEALKICSDDVKVVNHLRKERRTWDLEATLVEVDVASLNKLMTNYRHLIRQGGPDMAFDESQRLLDIMIEDARRLVYRSPILFRASTRQHIIVSTYTRYGQNHESVFQTFMTSQGIREILSLSASYYNALDPEKSNPTVQNIIRPRFLQMLVLFLSLLNDNDREKIQDFIESTYRFPADRANLEILFLRVIPLLSINSKVFLTAIVPAIENQALVSKPENLGHWWDCLVKSMLKRAWLLPGGVADLGRERLSWLVKWPEGGFHSSLIFNHLQYGGGLRTGNDIPPLELQAEQGASEIMVTIVGSDKTYIITPSNLERITTLQPGRYALRESDTGTVISLFIEEKVLNEEQIKAVSMANMLIDNFNKVLRTSKNARGGPLARLRPRGTHRSIKFLEYIPPSGRLTEHTATFGSGIIAQAFKLNGRKINKVEVSTIMHDQNSRVLGAGQYYSKRVVAGDLKLQQEWADDFAKSIKKIQDLIQGSENKRKEIERADLLSDEPIQQTIYNHGEPAEKLWFEYQVTYAESGSLKMRARKSVVEKFDWLETGSSRERNNDQIEVKLTDGNVYIAKPLKFIPAALKSEEIMEGDHAILAGQYLILAVNDEYGAYSERVHQQHMIMTNCMKITSVVDKPSDVSQYHAGRGANRPGGRGANRNPQNPGRLELVDCYFI